MELQYFLLGCLGFAAYEVGIRIIDDDTGWVKRIGWVKYCIYLAVFGGAVSFVSGGFATSFLPSSGLKTAFSVLFGLGMPSTIRMFAELVTKVVYQRAKKAVGGAEQPDDPIGDDERPSQVQELKRIHPAFSENAYKIGDFFGFSRNLRQ